MCLSISQPPSDVDEVLTFANSHSSIHDGIATLDHNLIASNAKGKLGPRSFKVLVLLKHDICEDG